MTVTADIAPPTPENSTPAESSVAAPSMSVSIAEKAADKLEQMEKAPEKKKQLYEIITVTEKKVIYFSLFIGMFLAALDQMIVAVSLPVIIRDLGGGELFAWVISAYLLTSSATTPLYGKFSDLFGRRLIYLLSIGIFLVASCLCALATSIWFLIAARGVQGIGGGGLMALTNIIIGDIFPPEERAQYLSSLGGVFAIASVAGPLLGGVFTDKLSWRWVFWINVPFSAVTLVLCFFFMRRLVTERREGVPIDILGSFLVASGTICLVLVFTWGGNDYAWGSALIICLIIAALILFALFIAQEFRHPEPIIQPGLFKIRNISVSIASMFVVGMAMLGVFAYLPLYLQTVRFNTATESGLNMIPMVMGVVAASMTAGITIFKTGKWRFFPALGSGVMAISLGLMGAFFNYGVNMAVIVVLEIVYGFGVGVMMPVYSSVIQNSAPPKDMASAMSAFTFFVNIGGSVGVAIFGAILNHSLVSYSNDSGFVPAVMCLANVVCGAKAFAYAVERIFLYATVPAILSFLLSFAMENVKFTNLHVEVAV
jgi:EmrB/QacA subfamily drug resistance transporter